MSNIAVQTAASADDASDVGPPPAASMQEPCGSMHRLPPNNDAVRCHRSQDRDAARLVAAADSAG